MKLTLEFKLIATLVIVGMMMTFSVVSMLKSFQYEKRFLEEKVLEQEHKIADFLLHVKEFIRTKNRQELLRLKQDADRIEQEITVINNGGNLQIGSEIVKVFPLENEEVKKAREVYTERFIEIYNEIDKLWNQSIRERGFNTNVKSGGQTVEEIKFEDNYIAKDLLEFLERRNTGLLSKNRALKLSIANHIQFTQTRYLIFNVIALVIVITFLVLLFLMVRKSFINPLSKLNNYSLYLSHSADRPSVASTVKIADSLEKIERFFEETEEAIKKLGEEEFDVLLSDTLLEHRLGQALNQTKTQLKHFEEQEAKNTWRTNGLATMGDVIGKGQYDKLEDITYAFTKFLVTYLGINQGAIYMVEEEGTDVFLRINCCFAYNKKRYLDKKLSINEGLVGQALEEKEHIYLTKVPDGYMHVSSGLGEATAGYLLIIPIEFNDKALGALEVASFRPLKEYEIEFARETVERFGATLSVFKMNSNTRYLLEDSRQMSQELRLQEALMKENTEELEATQEELGRKLKKLQEESHFNKSILKAIGHDTAMVEFDLSGKILDCNKLYADIMGSTHDKMIGINERELLSEEDANSTHYELLWESIKNGANISGEYRRIRRDGQKIWLNGAYNPILNLQGKPYKVIQFAQAITADKEQLQEYKTKVQIFSSLYPVLEISADGVVLSSNLQFQSVFGYKRKDIRKVKLDSFVSDMEAKVKVAKVMEEIHDGMKVSLQAKLHNNEGNSIAVDMGFHPLKDTAGKLKKVIVVIKA